MNNPDLHKGKENLVCSLFRHLGLLFTTLLIVLPLFPLLSVGPMVSEQNLT